MADEILVTTDSRPYKSMITDVGNAKMAQAILNGTRVNIVEMRLGDGGGSYYMPTTAATALVNQVWSGEIANKSISDLSPNIIAVKAVIPSSVGGFTIREASLHDDAGDMIAICNMPEIAKATLPDGISSKLDIVMNILLTNVEAVEFTINPTLDPASMDDVAAALAAHNADPDAHNGAVGGAQATVLEITIPKDGWAAVGASSDGAGTEPGDGEAAGTEAGSASTADAGEPTSGMYLDIAVEGMTADMLPDLSIYPADMETARLCAFSTSVRTMAGALRVYAQTAPAADMRATLTLTAASGAMPSGGSGGGATSIGNGLTYDANGNLAVKAGDGLTFDDQGALAVDATGLSDETAQALTERLAGTDAEAAAAIDEAYQ